ncbi:hypothetical protein [Prevotella fusca]|nr:hypothetical protein [Prevotella fusca]
MIQDYDYRRWQCSLSPLRLHHKDNQLDNKQIRSGSNELIWD